MAEPSDDQTPAISKFADLSIQPIDRYQIERTIGAGGMSTVMLALDKQLNRRVAMKIPHSQRARTSDKIEQRIVREVQLASSIRHPHLCEYYDLGLDGETIFITMEYIDGLTLEDVIQQSSPLSEEDLTLLFSKLTSALHELHEQGVVHRDLKPENIMISQEGRPVVMDFGLAKIFEGGDDIMRISATGQQLGTPTFMSPEQVKTQELTPASDIYSLGVTLWSALCAQRPFQGDMIQIANQILHKETPSPRTIRPDLSIEMEAICLRSMAKKPEDRFSDMREFQSALEAIL